MRAYLILARPHQWIKNGFLLAPLIFSKHLFETSYVSLSLQAFFVFCLAASTIYILNDILDREVDRFHPVKRKRPIAAGTITVRNALLFTLPLVLLLVVLISNLNRAFMLVVLLYVVINVLYSLGLKKIVLLDVFIVALGFMLRVIGGAVVINVEISHWLVLCTLFVSLFLAVSKRRGELILAKNTDDYSGRSVVQEYEIDFLDQAITVSAAGMAISYALYTVAERTVRIFGTEHLIFTTVFVLFGIFRYLYLMRKKGSEDNPTYLLLTDLPMLVNITAWFIACIMIIYSDKLFP